MKIKNQLVLALVSNGVLNITATTLNASEAYKIIKFRRVVKKAFDELSEKEKDFIKDLGLEIGENGKLEGKEDDIKKFGEFQKALYEDDVELGDIKAMPYDAWHELQKENKALAIPFIEDELEGILWTAPEE